MLTLEIKVDESISDNIKNYLKTLGDKVIDLKEIDSTKEDLNIKKADEILSFAGFATGTTNNKSYQELKTKKANGQ